MNYVCIHKLIKSLYDEIVFFELDNHNDIAKVSGSIPRNGHFYPACFASFVIKYYSNTVWLDSFPLLSQRTRTRHYFPINPNWQ